MPLRFAVTLLLTMLLCMGEPGYVRAQGTMSVKIIILPVEPTSLVYDAQEQGFFTRNGLSAQIELNNASAVIASVIASGGADIGWTNTVTFAQAVERGLPLTVIFPGSVYSSKAPTTVLMVAKNSPIRTAKDLNGKIVAVTGLGGITQVGTETWIDEHGGDSRAVHFIDLPPAEMPAALEQGRVDAVCPIEPMVSVARRNGDRVLADELDALGNQFVNSVWFTTKAWADAHPAAVARLRSALKETGVWTNTHPKESADIVERYFHIKSDVVAQMGRTTFAENMHVDMQPLLDASYKYGLLKQPLRGKDLLWPE